VLQFLGVVREQEDGRALSGIRYTYYEKMAWEVLEKTIEQAQAEYGQHGLDFHHRIGFVSVAEPSVLVRVSVGHSQRAFNLCQHYLKAVKTTLPIWKEPVFAS
jgi:molybdopterin synthase catalytic subunit